MASPTGVGIGLRKPFIDDVLRDGSGFDFLEIVPENYVGRGGYFRRVLDTVSERHDVLVHGVSMSLGGPDPFDPEYIEGLKVVLDVTDPPFYTDHLCYATVGGFATHELLPLPFTQEAVRHTATRIRELRDRIDRPVAVENIAFYAVMPGSDLHFADFVHAVCDEADCGLLLDVNNVFVNASNHGESPSEVLHRLPLHRALQIHMAGHAWHGPRILDTHGEPVCDEVFTLYREALGIVGACPTLLEWDTKIPELPRVLQEAAAVRAVYEDVIGPVQA